MGLLKSLIPRLADCGNSNDLAWMTVPFRASPNLSPSFSLSLGLLPPLLLETKGLADKAKCAILSCRPRTSWWFKGHYIRIWNKESTTLVPEIAIRLSEKRTKDNAK